MRATIAEQGADGTQPREPWQRIMQVEMEELLLPANPRDSGARGAA